MIPMGMQNDEWIASVASYVRNAFGNRSPLVTPEQVARVRAATKDRTTSWTFEELAASIPRQVVFDSSWKFDASHNPRIANYAVTIQPWTSGAPQAAGMWWQVELPQAVNLTEIQFEAGNVAPVEGEIVPGAPPRTGAGRGGPGSVAPALGFPRGYKVEVSTNGTAWTQVADGQATGLETAITFAPTQAKFVRVTQTASPSGAPPFAMQRLKLYEQR
jgi:hypothetical protein